MHRVSATIALILLTVTVQAASSLPAAQPGVRVKYDKGTVTGVAHSFIEYVPTGYHANPDAYLPIIIYFGGTGERGDGLSELSRMENDGPLKVVKNGSTSIWDYDDIAGGSAAIVIAPQLSQDSNEKYTGIALDAIDGLIDVIIANRRVDETRIYCVGSSLGGGGVWDYAQRIPDRLAAIVPICGASFPASTKKFDNLSAGAIWAFHGSSDGTVSPDWTRDWLDQTVDEVDATAAGVMSGFPGSGSHRTAGFNADDDWDWFTETSGVSVNGVGLPAARDDDPYRYTLYNGVGHNSWTQTFNNPDMWTWLLDQTLGGSGDSGSFTPSLIVDNSDSADTTKTGSWSTSTGVAGYHGANYHVANSPGGSEERFTYRPDFSESGTYDVYVWYSAKSSRDDAVPIDIDHAGGRTTAIVNQRILGSRWRKIGTASFDAGRSGSVTIGTDGTSDPVVADAVGFERVGPFGGVVRTVRIGTTGTGSATYAARISVGGEAADFPAEDSAADGSLTDPFPGASAAQAFSLSTTSVH